MKKLQNGDVDKELKKVAIALPTAMMKRRGGGGEEVHEVVDCATQGIADLRKEADIGGEVFNSQSITSYQPPIRQASKRKSKPIVSSR